VRGNKTKILHCFNGFSNQIRFFQDQTGRLSTFTFQAVSELDRKKWLTMMGGKEPQIIQNKVRYVF